MQSGKRLRGISTAEFSTATCASGSLPKRENSTVDECTHRYRAPQVRLDKQIEEIGMNIVQPAPDPEATTAGALRQPMQLLYVDPYPDICKPFFDLVQENIVTPHKFDGIEEIDEALSACAGTTIVSITSGTGGDPRLLYLAERAVRLNSSKHVHFQLMVLMLGSPNIEAIDKLESLGVRVFFRDDAATVEAHIRVLAWRFKKQPPISVPLFYLRYPDSDTLEVFLLGRIQRTQLIYGEKLATLFEMMALERHWVTSRQIADELDISRSSVKVYLDQLREEYDAKRSESGVNVPGELVFCSERHNGAWMHRLRAQILILD